MVEHPAPRSWLIPASVPHFRGDSIPEGGDLIEIACDAYIRIKLNLNKFLVFSN